MKKIILVSLSIAFTSLLFGQDWKSELPQNQDLSFRDYQDAFNSYFEKNPEAASKKGNGYKQFKRWEWYWSSRVTPQGEFPSNMATWNNWQEYVTQNGVSASRATLAKDWTSLGPNKVTDPSEGQGVGRINCIAFHPTDANTFWIGTPAGGLWKTTDNGSTWTTNTDNLPVLGVSDIAIHPTNPDTMWIATGDGDAAVSLGTFGAPGSGDTKSVGILKSINGGATWTTSYSAQVKDNLLIRRLIIDNANPDYLYAATTIGILATSNGGGAWQNVQSGYFMDLEMSPTSPDTLYASTFDENGGAEIYRSDDGGGNWSSVYNDTNVSRYNIEVTAAKPSYVYILGAEKGSEAFYEIAGSADRGDNWVNVANQNDDGNLLGWELARSDAEGQGTYDLAFAVSPNDEDEFYVGGVSTWKTTDGASSWTNGNFWGTEDEQNKPHSFPVVHADKHFLTYHPLRSNELYECNDGGVWRTNDKGKTWANLSDGLVISQMYSFAHSEKNSKVFVMGLQDNGSKGSNNGSWDDISGGDGMDCAYDDANQYWYTSYINGEIYRTHATSGQVTISENLPGGQLKGAWLTPFELDAKNSATIFAAYEEVYKSTNSGDSWVQLGNLGASYPLKYMSVSDISSDIIYVAEDQSIAMTNDGGTNWTDISAGLPLAKANISSVYADPTDKDYVGVTISGYEAGEKFYFSSDQGATWTNQTKTGLPNVPANCMAIDKVSEDLYIGTDVGVFLYDKTNSKWVKYGDKLPNVPIIDLIPHYTTSKLRVATFGRGAWEAEMNTYNPHPSLVEDNKLQSETEVKVYPNPGNDWITLELESFEEANSEIGIYNYLGELIMRVDMNSAEQKINVKELSSGIYYVGASGVFFQDFTRFVKN